jgi:hypothetical protein
MAYILENLEMSKLTYILGHFLFFTISKTSRQRVVMQWNQCRWDLSFVILTACGGPEYHPEDCNYNFTILIWKKNARVPFIRTQVASHQDNRTEGSFSVTKHSRSTNLIPPPPPPPDAKHGVSTNVAQGLGSAPTNSKILVTSSNLSIL